MNRFVYFKSELRQVDTCEEVNEYCRKNNCEPISICCDKFGNLIVVVKDL